MSVSSNDKGTSTVKTWFATTGDFIHSSAETCQSHRCSGGFSGTSHRRHGGTYIATTRDVLQTVKQMNLYAEIRWTTSNELRHGRNTLTLDENEGQMGHPGWSKLAFEGCRFLSGG
eukprot:2578558-Amphidinium_carterae.1